MKIKIGHFSGHFYFRFFQELFYFGMINDDKIKSVCKIMLTIKRRKMVIYDNFQHLWSHKLNIVLLISLPYMIRKNKCLEK